MISGVRTIVSLCLLLGSFFLPGNADAAGISFASCTVNTTSMYFGLYWGNVTLTSTATISISCNRPATTTVQLDRGQNSASYFTRKMVSGVNRINYNLYTSLTRRFIWGDGTAGSFTRSGKRLIVYGAIPAGQALTPGTYSDTVLVTVVW